MSVRYSPIATLNRRYGVTLPPFSLYFIDTSICRTTQDIVMPLAAPVRGKDGSTFTEVALPKGTDVAIAAWGSNINPAIWGEDAEEWKPERFIQPLPEALTEAHIPGVYSNLLVSKLNISRRRLIF